MLGILGCNPVYKPLVLTSISSVQGSLGIQNSISTQTFYPIKQSGEKLNLVRSKPKIPCFSIKSWSNQYFKNSFGIFLTREFWNIPMQNSNKPWKYGGYREICARSGINIEYPIGYTNLAPNQALYGIGSALSRSKDGTQLGTQLVYLIGYTFYVLN